jgi:hypothetical protein
MPDTTIKKVEAITSPRGEMGQHYLVAGKRVSMREKRKGERLRTPRETEYKPAKERSSLQQESSH